MCAKLAINGAKSVVPGGLQKAWPPINQDDIDAVVSVLKRANEQARKILAEHYPQYVTETQAREIDRITKEAQEYFVKTSKYSDVM